VDLKGEVAMTADYAAFVGAASAALKAKGKLLTSALALWFVGAIPDATLAELDFINVMSYDHCDPWTGACEQATYASAVSDLAYFTDDRDIPEAKVVPGQDASGEQSLLGVIRDAL
jgi:hypothetical protein